MSYLHIQFADGSNPFVKYGSYDELKKEIKRWQRNYDLYPFTKPDGNIQATAYPKFKEAKAVG